MFNVHKVIFPGIAAGCLFLVFAVNMIANPTIALASNAPPTQPTKAAPDNRPADAEGAQAPEEAQPKQSADQAKPKTETGSCSLSQSYPDAIRQWCGLIEQYAGENKLDANLIAAVMLQESGGKPDAYSKSGAVGLLQVMPNDGLASGFNCVNGPCFASRPSTAELYDPAFNVSYGARMLAELIQKYGGDIREALRAYGPMNMGYRYADIVISIMSRYR